MSRSKKALNRNILDKRRLTKKKKVSVELKKKNINKAKNSPNNLKKNRSIKGVIKQQQYSKNGLDNAIEQVKEGLLSIRTASKVFEVPKSTIHENVKKLQNKEKINNVRGRATVLSKQIEELIVQAIMKLADWGFNLTDKETGEKIVGDKSRRTERKKAVTERLCILNLTFFTTFRYSQLNKF